MKHRTVAPLAEQAQYRNNFHGSLASINVRSSATGHRAVQGQRQCLKDAGREIGRRGRLLAALQLEGD